MAVGYWPIAKSQMLSTKSFPKMKQSNEIFEQLKPYMTATMAYYESSRCLFCYDAPCVKSCPTGIDIPLFIRQINTGNVKGAARTIYNSNYFGNICGKVCPTEVLCEGACVFNHQDAKPIEIGRLQSFATHQLITADAQLFKRSESNGKRVAIIGAGPAGIACACELKLLGYEVDIFETNSQPGGLALHGCAPYKVTNEDVIAEIEWLQRQFHFQIHYNHPILTQQDILNLEAQYDALFLGIGLGKTHNLGFDDELDGCSGATEFIKEMKLDPKSVQVGNKVVVIGGGNTAIDAAVESAKLGAGEVILAYRRSQEEMPAYDFEFEHAKSCGVQSIFHVAPLAIVKEGKQVKVTFIKTSVQNGKVIKIQGTAFDIYCDRVILATGQEKQTAFLELIDNLKLNADGSIMVNPSNYQTSNPKYFAGGDAVNGGAEVVNAAAEGKKAAQGIHSFLKI
jgi:glutamate synthase (NADPH/NADH) small chain